VASHPLGWEAAQASGLCAVAVCLILCTLAVRPRGDATASFALRAHEQLGWIALAAAALHVGLLLAVDQRVVEHIKLTAPRYEYAGILALLTLLFLTVPAGAAVRQRLWAQHRGFQAGHVGAACLLVVTLAMHVLTTDRYVHGRAHAVAYTLLSGIVLLALLRPRTRRVQTQTPARFTDGLVFGRYSRLVLTIVLCSLTALAALLPGGAARALREPFLRRSQPLLLHFPHQKHWAVNCLQCHHNFADTTGSGSCISCHRSARADLRVGVEARFHELCLGCHRDPPAIVTGQGPVTGCDSCHAPPSPSDAALTGN
jgi:predicted CXXCH cytochrome family protein